MMKTTTILLKKKNFKFDETWKNLHIFIVRDITPAQKNTFTSSYINSGLYSIWYLHESWQNARKVPQVEENKWKYMFMYIPVFIKCNINDKKNLEHTCTNEYTWKTYSSIRVFNFTMFAYWIIFHRYKAIKQSNILQMVAFRAVKFADVRWLTKPREILQHSSENPEFVRNFMSQDILYLCALNMGVV